MNAEFHETTVSRIAAAMGEPARTRMLFCLMDGHARTSTELATVADVATSTASAHLNRLKEEGLVKVFIQGKHRFYSLEGPKVARALEALSVLVGTPRKKYVTRVPSHLREARICYDHMAGTLGVRLHNRFEALGWLLTDSAGNSDTYELTDEGTSALEFLGIDIAEARKLRRRFAYGCLDWSERRPHIGGALGAAVLKVTLKKKWVVQDLDSRAISLTSLGRREMLRIFGIDTKEILHSEGT